MRFQSKMSFLLVAAFLWSLPQTATMVACDTPVNRYALYRWQPSPYEIYYFYLEKVDPADEETNQALVHALDSSGAVPNLRFFPVDLSDSEQVSSLPPEVGQIAYDLADDELPIHLVTNPRGAMVFSGQLTPDDVVGLVNSPARRQLASLLSEGHDGVFVFVNGAEARGSERALKEVEEALDRVGKSEEMPWNVGLLTLSRGDSKETWLRRCLLSVERLEPEDLAHPMVFAVYGRGRAMEPYLGAGIEADNLLNVVRFVNGPCSCQVKEQNPGVDLLITWDWEKAAQATAQKVGAETGNEHLLEGETLWEFSDLSEVSEVSSTETEAEERASVERPLTETTSSELSGRRNTVLGIGLAVAVLVLAAATLFFLRNSSRS